MSTREAILAALAVKEASFVGLIKATCGDPEWNVNLLPGVLYQLIKEGRVTVDCGVYSVVK